MQYRAVVRVLDRKPEGWITIDVPAWTDHRRDEGKIQISLGAFKPEEREKFQPGYSCFATVNLDVHSKYDLTFTEWALP